MHWWVKPFSQRCIITCIICLSVLPLVLPCGHATGNRSSDMLVCPPTSWEGEAPLTLPSWKSSHLDSCWKWTSIVNKICVHSILVPIAGCKIISWSVGYALGFHPHILEPECKATYVYWVYFSMFMHVYSDECIRSRWRSALSCGASQQRYLHRVTPQHLWRGVA